MDFLDVNDLASVNQVIAEASQKHGQIVKQQRLLDLKSKKSKLSKKTTLSSSNENKDTPAVETDIYQTVSATSI